MGSAGMLPAVRGILPRTQCMLENVCNPMRHATEIPSGRMPYGASRMLALPNSFVFHERDNHPQRSRDRSREQAG
jgi:hypothetical protein